MSVNIKPKDKAEKEESIDIELALSTTYCASDLTTIFQKNVCYSLPTDQALELLSKQDDWGRAYFKRYVPKPKESKQDPDLDGVVVKKPKTPIRIIRTSKVNQPVDDADDIDTAEVAASAAANTGSDVEL